MSHIAVIDLESTCWEAAPPEGQVHDIIEIGVCLLDLSNLEICQARSIPVKPTRSTVSEFCTTLTGWTQAGVDKGYPVGEAFDILRDCYHTKDKAWASWGAYDRKMIEQTASELGLVVPVSRKHLNVKTLFATMHDLDREIGMNEALVMTKMNLVGRHHSGVDDAKNIARLLRYLLTFGRQTKPSSSYHNPIDDPRLSPSWNR